MDIINFGQKIKSIFSQYNDIPDEELGKKTFLKFPQYHDLIDNLPNVLSSISKPKINFQEVIPEFLTPNSFSSARQIGQEVKQKIGEPLAKGFKTIQKSVAPILKKTRETVIPTVSELRQQYTAEGLSEEEIQKRLTSRLMESAGYGVTSIGLKTVGQPILKKGAEVIAKEAPKVFQGFKDLTTKVLERLKGKSITSKQEGIIQAKVIAIGDDLRRGAISEKDAIKQIEILEKEFSRLNK